MKPKLIVSFSGGRSSALMAWLILTFWGAVYEIIFVFANTGKEREETLVFADRCDREWGLRLVWLESVVNGPDVACTHKVVDFKSAARNGEPFEAVIQKYGIPNVNYLHCTRELKANPIRSYAQSIGWRHEAEVDGKLRMVNDFVTAQGMRVDEPKRTKPKNGVIYPLVTEWPRTKSEVLDWWAGQNFDLGLKDHQGNCDGCHKKSIEKLVRIAQETPRAFDWWTEMGDKYPLSGHNVDGTPRTFYRGRRTARDIVAMSKIMTLPPLPDDEGDEGCAQSCEVDFEEVYQ